jgi:zinc transport system substrate-binding protein
MISMTGWRGAVAAVAALVTVSACAPAESPPGGQQAVVAAFYPLAFAAQQIGGTHVRIRNLVKPGTEPHDLDLTPHQVAAVADADVVFYLGGLQPAVDQAVASEASDTSLDVATVQPLRDGFVPVEEGSSRPGRKGKDPHVWLDPVRYAAISDAIGARLATADPAHRADYAAHTIALHRRLDALDAEYRAGLANCRTHTFIVSHNAFGYLASRYGLTQQPMAGLDPDADLSAGRMAELTRYATAHHVRVIFFEKLASPRLARTLATEIGADARVLDPIEGVEPGDRSDYFSVMRANLAALRTALACA